MEGNILTSENMDRCRQEGQKRQEKYGEEREENSIFGRSSDFAGGFMHRLWR